MAHILVIDDDPGIRKVIRKVLERAGHDLTEAGHGAEGIRRVREDGFDLVITDLIMPEKEGIETIQELREEHPNLRIVAISGGGRVGPEGPLADAELFGADATLEKPFELAELEALIERLLD